MRPLHFRLAVVATLGAGLALAVATTAVPVTAATTSSPAPTASSGAASSGTASSGAASSGAGSTNATAAALPRATTTTIASLAPKAATKVTLTATVSPRPTGGTVAFSAAGTTLTGCSAAVVRAGLASCSASFGAGQQVVTARYSGYQSAYRASTGTRAFAVTPAAITFVGSLGSCTTSVGALVAVDFGHFSGTAVRGCDPNPTTGITLLTTAGFTTAGDQHDGPYFICRIGHPLNNSGTQYPTPAQDPCLRTPPTSAYWSYWIAPKGQNSWTYSPFGVYSDQPKAGDVQAWTFGATDVAGSTGQPAFTPSQVRSGLPATATAKPQARAAGRAAASSPDLGTGADYLVGQLTNGQYYDSFGGGFADFGLTIDGAFALAATGSHDTALAKVVDFLDNRGQDGFGRTVDDWTGVGTAYASGGSVGKLALLAEVVGRDPRSFAGHNLIQALDGLVCAKADGGACAAAGNYQYASSTFSQALAVLAQLRAGDSAGAVKPVSYLESLQRASGGFPSIIPPANASDAETDSTAVAAMALALVDTGKARGELATALHWLAGQQEADGGFPGASGDSVNSAAIAVQALRLDAQTYADQIAKAEAFLAKEQDISGGFYVAAGAESAGADVRASTQALGGAVGTPFGSLLDDLGAKSAAAAGANYMVAQLTGGSHYTSSFNGQSFDDQGLTADGAFALLSAGGHSGDVDQMVGYLKGQVGAYADPTGVAGGPYSGAAAKLALIAEATGGDPHAFGGTDLLGVLAGNVCAKAIAGDFSPCTAKGDFANAFSTVSQALGVLALQASLDDADHLTVDSPAVIRLHQLQCADGGFSSTLVTAGSTCTSEVDTTGFALQALSTVAGTDSWLGAGQAYLQKVQKGSGLFPGAAGDNSNSTALAAQALQALTAALSSPTPAQPQPRKVAPIVAWQSGLHGLSALAVTGGGFGITTSASADLRSSTQAVAATGQHSLLSLSGAQIRSLPRTAATAPVGGGTSPSATPSSSGSTPSGSASASVPSGLSSSGSAIGSSGLASTGASSLQPTWWALGFVLAGGLLLGFGRRRAVALAPRHAGKRRH